MGPPKSRQTFWGEEEQRRERAFRACTETSDTKFATTRTQGELSACAGVTVRDGRVDDLGSGCGVKNTVTIDTHRHGKVSAGCRVALFKEHPAGELSADNGATPQTTP